MILDLDVWSMATAIRNVNEVVFNYQLTALSAFARRAKLNGYWSKLIRADFFCGKTILATAYSLKYPAGSSFPMSRFNGFSDAQVFPRGGIAPASTSGGQCYGTGIIPSTNAAIPNANSIMIGIGVGWVGADSHWFGTFSVGTAAPYLYISKIAPNLIFGINDNNGASAVALPAKKEGFYIFNRKSAATVNGWKDGAALFGDTAIAASGLPNAEIFIGGRNLGNGGVQYGDMRLFSALIGIGFTDADCLSLSADHAIVMQDLRRAA